MAKYTRKGRLERVTQKWAAVLGKMTRINKERIPEKCVAVFG